MLWAESMTFEAVFLSSKGKDPKILQTVIYNVTESCQTRSFLNPRLMFFLSTNGPLSANRQKYSERAAVTRVALHFDMAAVGFYNHLAVEEADAHALLLGGFEGPKK